MDIDTVIKSFTHLLFEEKIIVAMENEEDLLPVCSALHSLIYPFEYCTFAPFLINDGEEEDINSLQQVSQPFTYFMGIAGSDFELVKTNLEEDEYPSPLLVDLRSKTESNKMFIRVDKSSTIYISDGMSRTLNSKKKEEMLPTILHNQLRNKIKEAIATNVPPQRERRSRPSMEKNKKDKDKQYDFSDQTVKQIRNSFFDTIVSLFIEY